MRAGLVEELFYRGYAIERLQSIGLNRYWAGIIPLLIFGFAHAPNGWANVILALALGLVLMLFISGGAISSPTIKLRGQRQEAPEDILFFPPSQLNDYIFCLTNRLQTLCRFCMLAPSHESQTRAPADRLVTPSTTTVPELTPTAFDG